jgi:hypothetical protein
MPIALYWIIGGAIALLAAGEGVNLAGQGTQQITDSTVKLALVGATLYVGFVALKAR